MTLADLIDLLRSAGIADYLYVTDGGLGGGECYGIEPVSGGGWSIYYSERGRKSPLESHASEDAACRAFLRHLGQAAS
jgi:hypothetical protein